MSQLLILFESLSQNRSELNICNFVEACYLEYYDRILRFTHSRGMSYPKDITQEVFRKLHQVLLNGGTIHFPSDKAITNYLFSAAKNLCYSEYRKQNKMILLKEILDSNERMNPYPTLNLNMDLETSLQLLGESSISCMQLRLEGYKYDEIAKLKDLPLETVRTTLRRTRKKLRTKLRSIA